MVGTPVLGYPAGAAAELLAAGIVEVCYSVQQMADLAADILREGGRGELFSLEAQAARLSRLLHGAREQDAQPTQPPAGVHPRRARAPSVP